MTTAPVTEADLYRFEALLLPWDVRGLKTLAPYLLGTKQGSASTSWHDGDTFCCLISEGFRTYGMFHVRCAGYDAPELHGDTYDDAVRSRDFAQSLVDTGGVVYLNSIEFLPSDEEDNFGRALGRVWLPSGADLAQLMIESKNADPA